MGGGMVCGEPYDYGFRYPSRASGTPMYSSVFHPRRQSGFRGDEWIPKEVTNLARKRKLDGVKGEPLGAPNGTNVREIFVEDPSKSKISPTQGSQGYRDAHTSCGNSPPSSPSVRGGSRSAAVGEGRTVTIPVVFSEAAKEQPVPVVPQEGTKKPRRTCSDEAAAAMIQSVFRGYVLRKTKPLEHMRKISSIRMKLKDYERQLSDATIVEKMRSDVNVRLRVTEGIMTLLLQLDAIQGVHPDIRVWRKAVTKEVVTLQEKVDILLKGGETLGTKPVYVEPIVEGHNEDTAMAVEDDSAVENQVSKTDDVVTEIVYRESLPECRDVEDNCADEIALHQLKLVDEEIVCQPDEMVVGQDTCDDIGERLRGASGVEGGDCAMRAEQIGRQEEAMQNGGLIVGLVTEGNDNVSQHTRSTSQVSDRNGAAGCETMDRTRQPMNDESETKAEKRDDGPRGEESVTLSSDMTGHTHESSGTLVEFESSEAPEIEITSTIAERGMEVDREKFPPQNQGEVLAGNRNEFRCSLNCSPGVHEKMKYFLKEISAPSEKAGAGRVSHCARLNGAEEMDCHGAPGSSSDVEENDGAAVGDMSIRTRNGKDDPGEGAETSGRTENPQHDRILSKLCEENKMLKLLLVDVMKWNQLQANHMRDVTERLGKLEDRLMAKQKKSSGKPQAQRCNRSKLERRLRR